MKELYLEICDLVEPLYSSFVKPADYFNVWKNIVICLFNGTYRIERDSCGKLITYQGWHIIGDTIIIEDNCTLNKNKGIQNLIKEIKARYSNKGINYIQFEHRGDGTRVFNIARKLHV